MKKTILGKTGVEISMMGLGCMYFGSKVDERTSFRLMDLYLEQMESLDRPVTEANKY